MKNVLFPLSVLFFIVTLVACGGSSKMEEVELPTMGLITVLEEVEPEKFLIEDEITIPDTSGSLIIANYMTGESDTFSVASVRLLQEMGYDINQSSVLRAASFGLMGYFMGRRMGAFSPSAGAYTSPDKFNKVNNSAGTRMRSSAVKTSRPVGKSGFGSGSSKSTRSVGG